ncbi:hypothetical protein [Rhodopila sp.]|uniref:hypothetical protein n=1 Tax=Rhodopila sp. TaxID=2480087 RepID=UPI003D0CCEF6
MDSQTQTATRNDRIMEAMIRRGFQPDRSLAKTAWWNGEDIAIREAAVAEIDGNDTIANALAIIPEAEVAQPETTARAALRKEITKREILRYSWGECQANQQRAADRVIDLTERLGQFCDLDEEIMDHARLAISQEEDQLLPAHVQARRAQRDRLADHYNLVEATHQRFTTEVRLGAEAVQRAEQAVAEAATAVLAAVYLDRLAECEALEQQAATFRTEIASFAATWFPVTPVNSPLGTLPNGHALTVAPGVAPVKSKRLASFLQTPPANAQVQPHPERQAAIRAMHEALTATPADLADPTEPMEG